MASTAGTVTSRSEADGAAPSTGDSRVASAGGTAALSVSLRGCQTETPPPGVMRAMPHTETLESRVLCSESECRRLALAGGMMW